MKLQPDGPIERIVNVITTTSMTTTNVQSNLAKGRIANLTSSWLRMDSSDTDRIQYNGSLNPRFHLHRFSRFFTRATLC